MRTLFLLTAGIIGYLSGSVSVAVILSRRVFGGDVREQGSGNAGATNVARVFGMRAGLITLVGDVLKTVLSMFLGGLLAGAEGSAAAGAACMLGHCFPLFFQFRGGKGVSVGAAIAGYLDWRLIPIILVVFLVVYFCCRKVSLGSMLGAVTFPVTMFIFGGYPWFEFVLAGGVALLLIFQHRSNIRRLISGTESEFRPSEHKKP